MGVVILVGAVLAVLLNAQIPATVGNTLDGALCWLTSPVAAQAAESSSEAIADDVEQWRADGENDVDELPGLAADLAEHQDDPEFAVELSEAIGFDGYVDMMGLIRESYGEDDLVITNYGALLERNAERNTPGPAPTTGEDDAQEEPSGNTSSCS